MVALARYANAHQNADPRAPDLEGQVEVPLKITAIPIEVPTARSVPRDRGFILIKHSAIYPFTELLTTHHKNSIYNKVVRLLGVRNYK